jgi:hypothetical protein
VCRRNNPLDSKSTLEPTGRQEGKTKHNQDDPTYHSDNKQQTPPNKRWATTAIGRNRHQGLGTVLSQNRRNPSVESQ